MRATIPIDLPFIIFSLVHMKAERVRPEHPLGLSGDGSERSPSFLEKLGLREGDRVTVQRTNGDVESDWSISGYSHTVATGETSIEVKKPALEASGTTMRKLIPLEEFQRLNSRHP